MVKMIGEPDDTATLLNTTDAMVWAKVFSEMFRVKDPADYADVYADEQLTKDIMFGWFANAIEVGRQAGLRDTQLGV